MEPNHPTRTGLTPEDCFLLDGCGMQPGATPLSSPPHGRVLDWPQVLRRATHNRIAPLMFRTLRERAGDLPVPADTLADLRSSYLRSMNVATRVTAELGPVVERFRAAGIPLVLLRGLAAGTTLYGDPALRPFTDVDLLILRQDLPRARQCMEAAGCVAADGTLGPAYFETYHLHVTYRHRASGAMFELHWALDHRYVPFTIPYASIIASAREIAIGDVKVCIPCPTHDLLTQAVHAAKHAYFLPFLDDDASLLRRVIDEGCLMHFCDIARAAAGHGGELDWDRIVEESRIWNVRREFSVVLRTTERLFPGWVPGDVMGRLERLAPSWIERAAFRALDRTPMRDAEKGSKRPSRIAALRARPMFRPVRVLDLLRYMNPGPQFIRHRYRCRTATHLFRVAHPLVAAAELAGHAAACLR